MGLRSDTVDSSALLRSCARRPADEAAWEEFVRRYHPTILAAVSFVLRSKARRHEVTAPRADEIANDLVQIVYNKLIEERSQMIKRIAGRCSESIHHYLAMISVNVVRSYFADAETLTQRELRSAGFESAAEKA